MYICIVSQFAIKPVYAILISSNFAIHMTDKELIIQTQNNAGSIFDFEFTPEKGEYSFKEPGETEYKVACHSFAVVHERCALLIHTDPWEVRTQPRHILTFK
jgi:hypothetical protein